MKFTCEKSILQAAVNTASRAVPSKSSISALEGLLITSGEKLRITGYDLKKAIYTDIDADIVTGGSMVINARFFGEMIRRMPDGIITISSDENNNITAKCGKSEYNFIGLDQGDYPEMPRFSEINYIEIPQNILRSMITQTIFAVAKEEIRPIYTGTLFDIEDGNLTLVSVDGYRLAKRSETVNTEKMENCSFVVPGFALSDIEKICEDSDETVKISVGEKHISFTINDTVVITRRLEGEFLNYKKSIPEAFKYEFKVEKSEIISVIDRVALMLSEKSGSPIRMSFNDGIINCLCVTPIGKAEDVCVCSGDGEGLEIGFNDKYLLDAFKNADADELQICLNTSSSPCILKAADDSGKFTYMILPVRLNG